MQGRTGIFALMPLVAAGFLLGAGTADRKLTELRREYDRGATADDRIETLKKIAIHVPDGDDWPSPKIAHALAKALEDDSYEVRVAAVELLGKEQDVDVAVQELRKACRANVRDVERFHKDVELPEPLGIDLDELERLGLDEETLKWFREALEEIEREIEAERARLLEPLEGLHNVRRALVASLAGLRDDRAVDGIGILLEATDVGPECDSAIDALLAFGTQAAVGHVVGVFGRYEKWRKGEQKSLTNLDKQKPRKNISAISNESWKRLERERINAEVDAKRAELLAADAWAESVAARLRAFALARELPRPPTGALSARPWKAWLPKAKGGLPVSVAGKDG